MDTAERSWLADWCLAGAVAERIGADVIVRNALAGLFVDPSTADPAHRGGFCLPGRGH
jgi:hypothetical protein